MTALLQRQDDPIFLGRRHTAEEVHLLHPRCECRVIHLLDLRTGKDTHYREPKLGEDMLRDQFIIAGDDLDRDPIGGEFRQGRLGTLLGGIEEGREASKDQLRFITHHGMGVVHPHLP
ncbi:hypothetical protein D9M69_386730 [compost metagenome]